MKQKPLFTALLLMVVFFTVEAQQKKSTTTAPAGKPNIVIIIADDLGYADVSCQAAKDIKTPHIDGLVSKGVRCTDGYAAAPVGGPTRAAHASFHSLVPILLQTCGLESPSLQGTTL